MVWSQLQADLSGLFLQTPWLEQERMELPGHAHRETRLWTSAETASFPLLGELPADALSAPENTPGYEPAPLGPTQPHAQAHTLLSLPLLHGAFPAHCAQGT